MTLPKRPTPINWTEPQEVTDLDIACPGRTVGRFLPQMEEIPEEFSDNRNPWCEVVSKLFFQGGHLPKSREGIIRANAARHLRAVMGSYEPKHEHKIAGAAYLMSLWYELD